MKYKVGDIVKVHRNISKIPDPSRVGIMDPMKKLAGQTCKITNAWLNPNKNERYLIDIDFNKYSWTEYCFEPVKRKKFHK